MLAKPCAEFIAAARNELPAIRSAFAEKDRRIAELEAALWAIRDQCMRLDREACDVARDILRIAADATKDTDRPNSPATPNGSRGAK